MGLVLGILLMTISFTTLLHGQINADAAKRAAREDDIREAIFRFELKDRTSIIFLDIDHQDPSDTFMKRFSDVKLPIKKLSAIAKPNGRSQRWIYDRSSGKSGVALWVGKLTWISELNVVVDGGYYCGSLCAGRGDFYLTFKDGRWVVDKFDLKIVS